MDDRASILIIDDDYELASVLQTILRNKNYRTLVAHSAAQVASMLAQNNEHSGWPVSLILLDLMMPQVDGVELYGWLRAHPKTANTPIIVLSAVDSISKRVELLSRGADDYIVKPCPVEELLARVSIHIRLSELRQSQQAAEIRSDLRANYLNAIEFVHQQIPQAGKDLAATLNNVTQAIVQHFSLTNCVIYLADDQTKELTPSGRYPADFTPPPSYLPFLKRITLQKKNVDSGSALGVPLLDGNELLGVLIVQAKDEGKLSKELSQALTIMTRPITLAVLNHQLDQKIQEQANVSAVLTNGSNQLVPTQDHYDPLQTIYSYLQLLTEFEMEREKQIAYLKMASKEITDLLDNAGRQ